MPHETRFSLRLPHDLHTLLIERAAAEHRSLNAQIIHLLWQAFVVDADAFRDGRRHLEPVASILEHPVPGAPGRPARGGSVTPSH